VLTQTPYENPRAMEFWKMPTAAMVKAPMNTVTAGIQICPATYR